MEVDKRGKEILVDRNREGRGERDGEKNDRGEEIVGVYQPLSEIVVDSRISIHRESRRARPSSLRRARILVRRTAY